MNRGRPRSRPLICFEGLKGGNAGKCYRPTTYSGLSNLRPEKQREQAKGLLPAVSSLPQTISHPTLAELPWAFSLWEFPNRNSPLRTFPSPTPVVPQADSSITEPWHRGPSPCSLNPQSLWRTKQRGQRLLSSRGLPSSGLKDQSWE